MLENQKIFSFRMKNTAPLKDLNKRWVEEKYKSPETILFLNARSIIISARIYVVCWVFLRTCATWWDKSSAKTGYCVSWRGPQDCHNRKSKMRKHRGSKRHLNPLPILQQTSSDVTDISAKAGFILLNELYFIYTMGTNYGNSEQYMHHRQTREVSRHQACPGHAGNLTLISDINSSTQLASAFSLHCRIF